MPRKIEVVVTTDGRIEANFIGFIGEECFDEAEKLRRVLQAVGVEVDPSEVIRKGPERITLEAGLGEEEGHGGKARSGRPGQPPR